MILKQLYDGEIYPYEQYSPILEEHKEKWKKQTEHYEEFVKKLGSPLDEEFNRIMEEQLDTIPLDFFQIFTDGFRLGVKLMIEVFDYKENEKR